MYYERDPDFTIAVSSQLIQPIYEIKSVCSPRGGYIVDKMQW